MSAVGTVSRVWALWGRLSTANPKPSEIQRQNAVMDSQAANFFFTAAVWSCAVTAGRLPC